MGFISGTSTVTVEAKLTDAGKKKLYESIETNSSGFITKFAVGDSDANYAAVAAGSGSLEAGHVPEASEFKPSIRSFALYKGQYRPGIPVILVDNEYGSDNGIIRQLSIGGNVTTNFLMDIKTEWPKDEAFSEGYSLTIQNPGNLSDEQMRRYFTVAQTTRGWAFQFNGGLNLQDLTIIMGAFNSGGYTTIPVKIVGRTTNASVMYNIQLVQ